MENNRLPEDKLLELIRKDKKISTPVIAIKLPLIAGLYDRLSKINFSVYLWEKIGWGIFCLSFLYFIVTLISPVFHNQNREIKFLVKEKNVELNAAPLVIKPYSFYQSAISGRELFGAQVSGEIKKELDVNMVERIKDLSLTGILSADPPQAIIADKQTQKTYFLKKGDLYESMKVDEIGDGKVVLDMSGQKFELYL